MVESTSFPIVPEIGLEDAPYTREYVGIGLEEYQIDEADDSYSPESDDEAAGASDVDCDLEFEVDRREQDETLKAEFERNGHFDETLSRGQDRVPKLLLRLVAYLHRLVEMH